MTIAAAYIVSEGIVFGADSTTTITVPTGGISQLLNHAQKVFEIGNKSRFALCTWGSGKLGSISHRTISARLSERIDEHSATVDDVKNQFISLIDEIKRAEAIGDVGYFLGGWNPGTHLPQCYKIEVNGGNITADNIDVGVCQFAGQPSLFIRVFRGFDMNLPGNLLQELKNSLGPIPNFDTIFMDAFNKATIPLVTAGFQDLPIREAIDYVYLYLHLTIKATKFKFGAPTCGGPIEIGFISTDRKFRWVCHKPFESAIVEQEGLYEGE